MVTTGELPLTILLFALQGAWGLFLIVLAFALRRVLRDISENTRATTEVASQLHNMNILLAGNYVLKSEYDRLEVRIRASEGLITELRTQYDYRDKLAATIERRR